MDPDSGMASFDESKDATPEKPKSIVAENEVADDDDEVKTRLEMIFSCYKSLVRRCISLISYLFIHKLTRTCSRLLLISLGVEFGQVNLVLAYKPN